MPPRRKQTQVPPTPPIPPMSISGGLPLDILGGIVPTGMFPPAIPEEAGEPARRRSRATKRARTTKRNAATKTRRARRRQTTEGRGKKATTRRRTTRRTTRRTRRR